MSTQVCCWEGTSDGALLLKLIDEEHNAARNVTKESLIALFHLFDHVQLNSIKYSYLLIFMWYRSFYKYIYQIIADCLCKLPFWQCKKKTIG